MIKEFFYTKAHVFAAINVGGSVVSLFTANRLALIAGIIAVLAGIINISIQYHQWRNIKKGWAYQILSKVFKWKKSRKGDEE